MKQNAQQYQKNLIKQVMKQPIDSESKGLIKYSQEEDLPRKNSSYDTVISSIDKNLEETINLLSQLEIRLSIVLRQSPPGDNCTDDSPPINRAPLIEHLSSTIDLNIMHINYRIKSILERLDI